MTTGAASFFNIEKFSLWVGKPSFEIGPRDSARNTIRIPEGRKEPHNTALGGISPPSERLVEGLSEIDPGADLGQIRPISGRGSRDRSRSCPGGRFDVRG